MILVAVENWLMLILVHFGIAKPQFPMPYPMPFSGMVQMVPGPPQPVPVPVPMPMPFGVPIPVQETTEETTSTTCKPHEAEKEEQPVIKIYIPWPPFPWPNMPLPFPNISIPALENQNFTLNLPPQMPYHMIPPAFPMPMPMPAPPPLVMIPIPPMIGFKRRRHPTKKDSSNSDSSSSSSDDSDESDSSSSDRKSRKKNRRGKNKKNYGIYRSHRRLLAHDSSKEEIKPILTYESQNGDIKLQKRLSMREASLLIANTRKSLKNVHVMANNGLINKQKVSTLNDDDIAPKNYRRAQVVWKNTSLDTIGKGHKELLFKVPHNKTISNLTVSFNINR